MIKKPQSALTSKYLSFVDSLPDLLDQLEKAKLVPQESIEAKEVFNKTKMALKEIHPNEKLGDDLHYNFKYFSIKKGVFESMQDDLRAEHTKAAEYVSNSLDKLIAEHSGLYDKIVAIVADRNIQAINKREKIVLTLQQSFDEMLGKNAHGQSRINIDICKDIASKIEKSMHNRQENRTTVLDHIRNAIDNLFKTTLVLSSSKSLRSELENELKGQLVGQFTKKILSEENQGQGKYKGK